MAHAQLYDEEEQEPYVREDTRYIEPALTMLSGALAEPVSGLAGIAGSLLPGESGQGADWVEGVQEAMTYEPRTEEGQQGLQDLGETMQEGMGWLADATGTKGFTEEWEQGSQCYVIQNLQQLVG